MAGAHDCVRTCYADERGANIPTPPSGLTATAISTSQINLGWTDNSNNETGFKIDQATNSGFTTGLTTVTVGANATTYSATGLSSGTTYYYRVRATNANGDSANTATASATTQGTLPAAPSGLSATAASSSQINLSWTDNSNNEAGFKIDQATNSTFTAGLTTVTVGANVTTYSATGLSSNTTYYYRARATNGTGDSANTATASATTQDVIPAAPSGLSATTISSSQIKLSWTDNSNNEAGFKIDRATNSTFTTGLTTVTVGANVITYSATGLSSNTTYYFRVRSTNAVGDSANTSTASATTLDVIPAVPSRLTATAVSSSQVNLGWTDNSSNETGFKIDQATNSAFTTGLTTVTVGANVTTYSAIGLSASTTYYYRVRSTNAVGDSANTSTASATTTSSSVIPVPDGNFTDTANYYINSNTGGGYTFTAPMNGTLSGWSLSANPSTAHGGLYSGCEPYAVVDNVTSGSGASPYNNNAAWLGNQPGSNYQALIYYPGELYNSGSVVGGAQPGAKLTMTTTGISAAAVTGATYTATIQYANVSWSSCNVNASANIALNILANGVVVGTGTLSGLAQNAPWTPVTASWTATSGYAGQAIQIQVVATNFLEGPGANQQWQVPTFGFANATLTTTALGSAPAAPSGLAATAASSTQINLGWTDNSNNETGFKIDQATNSGFTAGLTTVTVGANVTSYSATGLSAGTTYYYRVRSTNANGDSANTSTASATTSSANGVITVPDGTFTDTANYYVNSNTGGGLTFTSPMNGTLSGWSLSANPSTANGGLYSGWEPYAVVDNVTSGSGATPFNSNVAWIGNQPSSSYQALLYYPGELHNNGTVVGGAQPNAKLTMTSTGISAAAVTGTTYTAMIQYANVSWSSCSVNPSANVALNILANGVVVGTGTLSGLAQNAPWTPVTASWTATSGYAGQAIRIQVVANNFLEGPGSAQQWQVPTIAFANATLTTTTLVVTGLTVNSSHGASYSVQYNALARGMNQYADASNTFTTIPGQYLGSTLIRTAEADATSTASNLLSFTVNEPVTVYILYSDGYTTKPTWLNSFTDTGNNIVTTKATFSVYSKTFTAGTITLGGNSTDGLSDYGMYDVLIAPLL